MKANLWIYLFVVVLTCIAAFYVHQMFKSPLEPFKDPPPPVKRKEVPGKTVWLLWMQGWNDETPKLVQDVRKSWEQLNPSWNIELVTRANLNEYVDIPYIDHPAIAYAAKSDIIRLKLLAEHGGVWADATMLCMIPLDRWLYDAMEPAGFWMYHGGEDKKRPASWFMVSLKDSLIATRWSAKTEEFWKHQLASDQPGKYDYFWMDALFNKQCETDNEFLKEWEKVPFIWCESPGQSHMLAGKTDGNHPELRRILKHNPPYVVKLSHHDKYHENTNAYAAVSYVFAQEHAPYPLHVMEQREPRKQFADVVAVSSDCKKKDDVLMLYDLCTTHKIQLIVYDKCDFCKHIPRHIFSRPLENVGRDMHTFMRFVVVNYDNLPKEILFIPSNLGKHDRLRRFQHVIGMRWNETGCNTVLGGEAKFEISEYEGNALARADTKPFKRWYEKYIGPWDPNALGPCWNGIMRTNRDRISRHPKELYTTLLGQLSTHDGLEVVHYIERSMASIF